MFYALVWKRTETAASRSLCIDGSQLSLAHLLIYSFGFPKVSHIWKAGDAFTFIHWYISPQRTITFNCYCRLYFTVAQGCVKEGALLLELDLFTGMCSFTDSQKPHKLRVLLSMSPINYIPYQASLYVQDLALRAG